MSKKIFVDIGHGGADPGVVFKGMYEKNINLKVGIKVISKLEDHGFIVKSSRTTDTHVLLEERCYLANQWGADLFVSIHHNAGGGIGYEVIHSIFHGKGMELAKIIANEFEKIGQVPHGDKAIYGKPNSKGNADYYSVIRNTNMTAIITEFGYVDSKDREKFDEEHEIEAQASAIVKGICRFYNVPYKEVNTLEKWQKELGIKAVDYLSDGIGLDLLNNPDDWKNKLDQSVPNWLLFEMLKRIIINIETIKNK